MRLFFLSFLFFISSEILAQPCSNPGMTPQTSVAVCGTLVFPQANVPSCSGPNLPAFPGCTDPATTSNSVWYSFHCYQTGSLGFLITPLGAGDDYDWAVMDITGRQPQDVLTTNLTISVNLSGVTGVTGCTAAGALDVRCAGGGAGSQFNRMPTITAGHDYLIMVTNWSNSGLGYNITFTGGTAVLTDNQLPTIDQVGTVGCNSQQIRIDFSEEVLCNSITATGTEFTITDGTATYPFTSVTSQCSTGQNAVTSLVLNMQNPLPPGNYNLQVSAGTDANTVLDVCQTEMVAASFPFTIAAQVPLAINDVTYTGCAPTVLKLALSKPVQCNSITTTGSEFSINPGNPVISSVQTACGGSTTFTDTINIVLQNPLPHGNYNLVVNAGSDGNTLIDTCGTTLTAAYQFPFTIVQATTAPTIQSIDFDECKPFKVVVNFDKSVACNSISANGSEFTITPGALTVTGIETNCINGGTLQAVLTLSGNLPTGSFNVNINNGTDGNTLSDSCFAFAPAAAMFPFTTTQAPAPVYDSVQHDRCSPQSIKIFYSHPILCSSVNADGSEFSITGPAPVSITSVSTDATCSAGGYTHTLTLNLSQPINTLGTFTIHNIAGTDGNSVMDTCYAAQNINETIALNVLGTPSANFEDSVHFGCTMDTLVLSHPGGNGINSWQWTFSDGVVLTGASVSHQFPVSTVTAGVQLIVSNGMCSDTVSRTYTLNNAFAAAFSVSGDSLCRNSNFNITNTSVGNNLTFQWQYSDGFTFSGQTPPAHAFANPGNYNITLVASNNYGCTDDSVRTINVTDTPVVRFSGLNMQYCTDEQVSLTANISNGTVGTYTWNNGNGVSQTNQPSIDFSYNTESSYVVTLSATDRFCGNFTYSESTQVYKVPVFSLGNDITLCPGMTTEIGVEPITGHTYLWNTGAATSRIMSGPVTATYTLVADNHGCTASDDIVVKVMDNCLIKVPTAFTPNGDGLNDRLKAINADLAREFSLKVFNRFGQLVFATSVPTDGWDGKFKGVPADMGTYVWVLNYIHPTTGQKVFEKGTSILIR